MPRRPIPTAKATVFLYSVFRARKARNSNVCRGDTSSGIAVTDAKQRIRGSIPLCERTPPISNVESDMPAQLRETTFRKMGRRMFSQAISGRFLALALVFFALSVGASSPGQAQGISILGAQSADPSATTTSPPGSAEPSTSSTDPSTVTTPPGNLGGSVDPSTVTTPSGNLGGSVDPSISTTAPSAEPMPSTTAPAE